MDRYRNLCVIALNARAAKPAADAGLQERVRRPMGFPFSRRVSLIPGLRVNLSKSAASLSVGGPRR